MVKFGTTRAVVITSWFVIKIPIVWKGLKVFLKGVLGNLDERSLYKSLHDHRKNKLAATYFTFFGLFNIMEVVQPLEFNPKYSDEENARLLMLYFSDIPIEIDICSRTANFGTRGGSMVMLDYAVCRESSKECDNCYCKHIDI